MKKLHEVNVALVPTLKLWKWEAERKGMPSSPFEKYIGIAQQQLGGISKAGGKILFGTDVGYMTDYDTTDEYILMAKAGLSFQQILAALTTASAARFGVLGQTGRVASGLDADLVLLTADPATDIRNFSKVKYTLHRGVIIYRSEPKAENP